MTGDSPTWTWNGSVAQPDARTDSCMSSACMVNVRKAASDSMTFSKRWTMAVLVVDASTLASAVPNTLLLHRTWEPRDNLSTHDACYVALAEALGCPMATADKRLANAPGSRYEFIVVGPPDD